MKRLLLSLLLSFLVVNPVLAAEGDEFSTTSFRINSDGEVVAKTLNELATTTDTVTTAEAGKVFLVDCVSATCTFTLPAAAAGLDYEFIAADDTAFAIDPAVTTDTIKTGSVAFSGGDKLSFAGVTGDSARFIAESTGEWYVTTIGSGWTDGN